jgi:hypothetical protein
MRGFGKAALEGEATPATKVSQMPQSARLPDDQTGRLMVLKTLISKR